MERRQTLELEGQLLEQLVTLGKWLDLLGLTLPSAKKMM